ncbi:MAG: ASCH domain-containing protein [Candidatus Verstraetearchaeota archaeon]|nr:ASCH domain-containing protein [Candidatus Verstraetearchaeota archaeon]
MRRLNFAKEYKKKIKEGLKRQTIRLSTSLREGEKVEVVAGGEVLGIAKITRVERKTIDELTDEDAKRDGFENVAQLLKALRRHYGRISNKKEVCVIGFEIERREDGQ